MAAGDPPREREPKPGAVMRTTVSSHIAAKEALENVRLDFSRHP